MQQLEIPTVVPAMMLPDTVFFPQSIIPLYIFEERYKEMLDAVLETDRMFAIIGNEQNTSDAHSDQFFETATLGYVKACQTYEDGTSTILLEGILRIGVVRYLSSSNYPEVEIIPSERSDFDAGELDKLQKETIRLLDSIRRQGGIVTDELLNNLRQIQRPQHFVDHATASVIQSSAKKLNILKCNDPIERYRSLMDSLNNQLKRIEILNELKGNKTPDQFELN